MRQIKFRGIFKVGDNDYYSEDEKNYIESKQHEILSISIGSHCTIAYQDTVMAVFEMQCSNYDLLQFTGLVDRNGKEIYEGDILETKYEDKCEEGGFGIARNGVSFKDGCFGTIGEITREFLPFSDYPIKDEYIIGNIHDNPELLNEKQ